MFVRIDVSNVSNNIDVIRALVCVIICYEVNVTPLKAKRRIKNGIEREQQVVRYCVMILKLTIKLYLIYRRSCAIVILW